ncbi:hypothetical protein F5Y17DRAFT_78112 [Xylariaceae sp. FL0594]|nr:hypothetical protein F5Y17DRAFT_78112 [Xylariaceae sp. FL0594]
MDGLGAMDLTAMVPSSPAPLPSPPPPKRPRHEVITTESDESDGPVEPVDHVDHVDPEANTGTAGKGKELCKDDIETIFPRICPDYVAGLSATHGNDVHAIIFAISEKLEVDGKYPVRPGPGHCQPRKRKRSSESSDSEDDLPNRRGTKPGPEDASGDPEYLKLVRSRTAGPDYAVMRQSREYIILALNLLCQDFKFVPRHDVQRQLIQNKGSVLETYIAMDEQLRNADRTPVPWTDMERPTEVIHRFAPGRLLQIDMGLYTQNERAALVEFAAARKLREDRKAQSEAAADEQQKLALARANGELVECGICFEECMVSRMVECQGDIKHRFCRSCMRSQAETEIGMSRHVLSCMSVDGCSAGFSVAQKELFLDEQLAVALDRIEAAENLRAAGIENLATCPFCPYAAEYPPVEVDKEFRCENPSCLQVSCRLCRRATHIPKSCAEDAAERGLNARHTLEEAMSEALIRRCNNCSYPFVKIDGCNKITCVKCRTKQCDVCRRTITHYNHFDDESRGGKRGRCPLYDRWDKRHAMEVNNAEKEARKKVLEEDPGVVRLASEVSRFGPLRWRSLLTVF